MSEEKTASLAHLSNEAVLKEIQDRLAGYEGKVSLEDIVICAYWDDFELTDEQFSFLMERFDNFRPGYEARV